MRVKIIVLIAAMLVACSRGEPEAVPEARSVKASMIGGVDLNQPLRALGTEPFWGVDITPGALVYSGVDRPERRASNPGPVIRAATATFTTTTSEGAALVVTLKSTDCSDGMSDRTYPLTARVEVDGETLNGCAASVAFLRSTDEQGT